MPYGFYISAEGAQVQSRRLEVIANNMANVDTVGFKRELAICQARYAEAIQDGRQSPGSGATEDIGGGVMLRQTKTDFSNGALKHTQNPADMAIDGEGFFLVRKGDENFLTRAGNFRLTSTGALVTQQGHAVLNDTGTPIVLNRDDGEWDLGPGGVIRQRGGAVHALALVRPASYAEVTKVGENLFRAQSEPQPVAPGERRIVSGYLETPTVKPTTEMVAMIEASRLFEANVNLLKAQDQMLGGLINRMLRV